MSSKRRLDEDGYPIKINSIPPPRITDRPGELPGEMITVKIHKFDSNHVAEFLSLRDSTVIASDIIWVSSEAHTHEMRVKIKELLDRRFPKYKGGFKYTVRTNCEAINAPPGIASAPTHRLNHEIHVSLVKPLLVDDEAMDLTTSTNSEVMDVDP